MSYRIKSKEECNCNYCNKLIEPGEYYNQYEDEEQVYCDDCIKKAT